MESCISGSIDHDRLNRISTRRTACADFRDIAALSDGEIVNFSNIARECGVSSHTTMSHFQILEDTLLGRWRLASGIEVDFVLGDMQLVIEAKSSDRISRDHLKGLRSLALDHPRAGRRIVVSREARACRTDDGIEILPAATFVKRLWTGELTAQENRRGRSRRCGATAAPGASPTARSVPIDVSLSGSRAPRPRDRGSSSRTPSSQNVGSTRAARPPQAHGGEGCGRARAANRARGPSRAWILANSLAASLSHDVRSNSCPLFERCRESRRSACSS